MDAQAFNFSLKEGQFDLTECHENTNIAFNLTEWEAHESTGWLKALSSGVCQHLGSTQMITSQRLAKAPE